MPSTNEVISLVNAADTAVRTACVLDLLKDSVPVPPFAEDAIGQAITMLDDALLGSALLTGKGSTQGFSGNLDALCWATDSYVAKRADMPKHPDPADVEKLLEQIRGQMNFVRERMRGHSPNGTPHITFKEAKDFFDVLGKMLARRATASLTRPTRTYASVGNT